MNTFFRASSCALALLVTGVTSAGPVSSQDERGHAFALMLNRNFQNTASECVDAHDAARGPYWCSGVILRGVRDGDYNPWEPSPTAIARGSMSYSWIRGDLNIAALWGNAGLINLPPGALASEWPDYGTAPRPYGVMCVYTFDAYVDRMPRDVNGCGFEIESAGSEGRSSSARQAWHEQSPRSEREGKAMWFSWGSCDRQLGIATAAQWQAHYLSNGSLRYKQCSWSADFANGWAAMLEVRSDLYPATFLWNELLVFPLDNERELSFVAAYFYDASIADSLALARTFQNKTIAAGRYVPIVRLDFQAPAESRFAYRPSDQVEAFSMPRR